ncbi:flagellar motor protein MotB [Desulfothermobacter acidiphilus]|uniref:flagellar motor protein MotB n=1 Tax=Desulfothermobacter acidiphilus TaxID=1938353 RepID=UPI003F8BB10E
MKLPSRKETEVSRDRWLITYADLITLLLIFFIVLYTFSKVDAEKFAGVAEALSRALGGGAGMILEGQGPAVVSGAPEFEPGHDAKFALSGGGEESLQLEKIKAEIEKYAKEKGLQAKITARIEERGLVVSVMDTVLFPIGSAELTPQARGVVDEVGKILLKMPNCVRIEGHTCDLPIHTPRYPSNWELSVARATSVVEELAHAVNFPPQRLCACGYGEYRPLVPNDSEEHRQMNRRVDFVVLRSTYQKAEPDTLPGQRLEPQKPRLP